MVGFNGLLGLLADMKIFASCFNAIIYLLPINLLVVWKGCVSACVSSVVAFSMALLWPASGLMKAGKNCTVLETLSLAVLVTYTQ